MNNKLLVICGPTATGKTGVALHLAKELNGELISADSRQVYKYMDIGTGKDKPEGVEIKGYDLVTPDHEFNISEYIKYANKFISDAYSENKLPILVGGTGFYISGVVDGIATSNIPRNEKLRKKLSKFSVDKLQKELKKNDLEKYETMNESDIKNPRRLIRAIEVAESVEKVETKEAKYDVLFVGLKLSKEKLVERIESRVDQRISQGFEKELISLAEKGYNSAISKTIGYKDWPDVEKWKKEEIKYAKRQMTWFKKDKRINWIDVSANDYTAKIEKLVETWHNSKGV